MKKLLLLLILNTFIITSVSYALNDNMKTKSELLKAMKRADTQSVQAITANDNGYIKSDPILQKMIEVYYVEEARELEVLKQEIQSMKDEEAAEKLRAEENAKKLALRQAEQERLAEEKATLLALQKIEDEKRAKALALRKAQEKKRAKALAVKKANKAGQTQKVTSKTIEPVKKAQTTTVRVTVPSPVAVVKPVEVAQSPVTNTQRYFTKAQLEGHWKQTKNKKKISFEMFKNSRFVIKERAAKGTLTLEGYYDQNDDELSLEINKITYNVRSRDAAVKRVYKLKNVSSNKLVLVDGKGNVVYTLER